MPMRFEVPQFIDIKDKIIGPLTFPQFLYVGGGAGLAYLAYRLIPTILKWPIAAIPLALGITLAFVKINGLPFVVVLQSFFVYLFSSKLYLWKQRPQVKAPMSTEKSKPAAQRGSVEKIHQQDAKIEEKLRDLAWNLDILDSEK